MTRGRKDWIYDPRQEMASPYNPNPPAESEPEGLRRIDGMLPGDWEIHMARLDALRETG